LAPADPIAADIAAQLAVPAPGLKAEAAADHAAITAFYAARQNAPLWTDANGLTEKAKSAIARIHEAADDGLNPEAFLLPDAAAIRSTPDSLARADLALTSAALLYAKQAQSGRIAPRSISPLITAAPPVPDPATVLTTLADAEDIAATLGAFNPSHAGYRLLRAKLVELRESTAAVEPPPVVPAGPPVRLGQQDVRVPLLRHRLGVKGAAADDTTYDEPLRLAVAAFQKRHGLGTLGLLGPQTVAALNADRRADPVAEIIANMERWRWMPRDLGERYVFVNIPEYMVRIVRDGAVEHETRVVVGKPTNQTPIFSNKIQFIIVNPSWHVPASIAKKEMLPMLRADPTYLARQGIEAVYVQGRKTQVIDSTMVDWSAVNMKNIVFRQPPGERNALGRIKFMFPNEHAVYLHDTPSRSLFARDSRAFSHGCVRVDQPLQFGEALMGGEGWDAKRIAKLIGGAERRVNLQTAVPVHLAYFTASVDDAGVLHTRPDIYGHDRKVRQALGLEGIATAAN
jgi:murein L,D-transpeptidase YcbB/YkuD